MEEGPFDEWAFWIYGESLKRATNHTFRQQNPILIFSS